MEKEAHVIASFDKSVPHHFWTDTLRDADDGIYSSTVVLGTADYYPEMTNKHCKDIAKMKFLKKVDTQKSSIVL